MASGPISIIVESASVRRLRLGALRTCSSALASYFDGQLVMICCACSVPSDVAALDDDVAPLGEHVGHDAGEGRPARSRPSASGGPLKSPMANFISVPFAEVCFDSDPAATRPATRTPWPTSSLLARQELLDGEVVHRALLDARRTSGSRWPRPAGTRRPRTCRSASSLSADGSGFALGAASALRAIGMASAPTPCQTRTSGSFLRARCRRGPTHTPRCEPRMNSSRCATSG